MAGAPKMRQWAKSQKWPEKWGKNEPQKSMFLSRRAW
jgi:hypothetical protein